MLLLRWCRMSALVVSCVLVCAAALPALGSQQQAAGDAESASETVNPSREVEEILNSNAAEDTYGDTPRCIAVRRIRSSTVLDDRHVALQVAGNSYYLVQFRNRCPQLERNSTISYETRTGQLCALDSIRAVLSYGGAPRMGPPCQIPGFQEVTREQLAAIGEELRERRRRPELLKSPEPTESERPES
jgi:hypothetical protein